MSVSKHILNHHPLNLVWHQIRQLMKYKKQLWETIRQLLFSFPFLLGNLIFTEINANFYQSEIFYNEFTFKRVRAYLPNPATQCTATQQPGSSRNLVFNRFSQSSTIWLGGGAPSSNGQSWKEKHLLHYTDIFSTTENDPSSKFTCAK